MKGERHTTPIIESIANDAERTTNWFKIHRPTAYNPHLNIWYYLWSEPLNYPSSIWLKSNKNPVFISSMCIHTKWRKFFFPFQSSHCWSISRCKYLKSALILLLNRLLSTEKHGATVSFLIIGFIGDSISYSNSFTFLQMITSHDPFFNTSAALKERSRKKETDAHLLNALFEFYLTINCHIYNILKVKIRLLVRVL